jgi:histidine triad (HIT) family protein
MSCIFCKIIAGEIPSSKVYETDDVLAFRDIHPVAPVHVLVIPKTHVESIQALTPETLPLVATLHAAIREVALREGIAGTGYRVIANCGEGAGQTVPHLHYHVIGGRPLGEKLL